ncbi:MAG: bifunctional UDP-N-acetylglucosamine diphosphorylase/glucosamine-1-phosphate N-acetyltransferase GlmU [Thermoleophilaceae bacterium]
MPEQPTVLIMAAGHGTRMRSSLPKVLHPVCGKPMIAWIVDAALEAGAARVVCVTRPGAGVAEHLPIGLETAEQSEGEGTGAALLAARDHVDPDATVVVLSGDHPLVSPRLIADLAATHEREGAAATLLTTEELDPTGYGRVLRAGDGSVERIVETKHPDGVPPEELAIREINIGAYAFAAGELYAALDTVQETGGELYLTGVFPLLRDKGHKIAAHPTSDTSSAMGVNSRADLLDVERTARDRLVREHAINGVSFTAPDTVAIEPGIQIGEDATIEAGVTLRGATIIGAGARVGPHATLIDTSVGERATVLHTYAVEAEVHAEATIGPFAYLRPGAVIEEGAKVGTYVEVKNSRIGRGAKVPHLSYIGDADVGEGTNIGAGNITANYDGASKHRTTIGANVRTSVDTTFVAPVRVGDGAYTGAGSVITEDVPPGALGIARSRQKNIEGYADRAKKRT